MKISKNDPVVFGATMFAIGPIVSMVGLIKGPNRISAFGEGLGVMAAGAIIMIGDPLLKVVRRLRA